MHTRKIVVFDLDGVLFDPSHRVTDFLEGRHEEYFAKVLQDPPIPQGCETARAFCAMQDNLTLFVTARGDTPSHRRDTLFKLRQHVYEGIENQHLLMRSYPRIDNDPDSIVKPRLIEAAGYDLNDVFLVFEDRDSVVAAWRERGVTCYQTQKGTW